MPRFASSTFEASDDEQLSLRVTADGFTAAFAPVWTPVADVRMAVLPESAIAVLAGGGPAPGVEVQPARPTSRTNSRVLATGGFTGPVDFGRGPMTVAQRPSPFDGFVLRIHP